MRWEKILLCLF